ncbi:MAG TPA: hypothetical protein VMY42_02875 [Thermoguttaceae bacterium]|nr:hypothetical protein [Thermoguttaceae bacterium]
MAVLTRPEVLVITMDHHVDPVLERFASSAGWLLAIRPARGELLRRLRRCPPQTLLFWLSALEGLDESIALIATVRQRVPEIPRIALGLWPDDELETAVRAAGANVYVQGENEIDGLQEAMAAVRRLPR